MTRETLPEIEARLARVAERLPAMPRRNVLLLRLLKTCALALSSRLHQLMRAQGLNEVAFHTMVMVYGSPDGVVYAATLSDTAGETRANMTRICDELERKGLLLRRASDSDRRRVELRLTRKGETLIEAVLPLAWSHLDRLDRHFSEAEKDQLEHLLRRFLAALEDDA